MKTLKTASREDVYTAPVIPWNNDTYTPISNKFIMDFIEDKISNNGLSVQNQNYAVATTTSGLIKGVIGTYDITTGDGTFGQRLVFRNSYDKSMSFAFAVGLVVFCCTNGCIKGDYQYKRVHRGVITDDGSTTIEDVTENVTNGFGVMNEAFENNVRQLNNLRQIEIGPTDIYDIIGDLFLKKEVVNVSQMSIIKKELHYSTNFKHLGDPDFTAYDLYNHITESLKKSHPYTYMHDHIVTHRLFEDVFNV